MPLQTTGPISLRDIQIQHNSSSPSWQRVVFGEFTRATGHVLERPENSNVPTVVGDEISFDDFYGTSAQIPVSYELIGGGGGGGAGRNNGNGVGITNGDDGGDTIIDMAVDGVSYFSITSSGAAGGRASTNHTDNDRYSTARIGDSSYYGDGGAGGSLRANGGNAPATSYGAGGGGGGGNVDTNKFGGIYNTDPSGEGGQASVKQENPANYLLEVPFGTTMTVTIGSGGAGASDGGTDGGAGAGGYVKINIDGTEYEYTVVGTHTETL
jgi:hypothetical protein